MRQIEPNHPYPEYGKLFVYEHGDLIPDIESSRACEIEDVSYYELLDGIGDNTFEYDDVESKIKKEWFVKYIPALPNSREDFYVFRIYDYKSGGDKGCSWTTQTMLRRWSVGAPKGEEDMAMEMAELVKRVVKIASL